MSSTTNRPRQIGRPSKHLRKHRFLGCTALLLAAGTQAASAQTWTQLKNAPPVSIGYMALSTDGTVLAHARTYSSTDSQWYKLTPDINGSYINGTWSQIASLPAGYAPIDFAGGVLADGKLLIEGGEYNNAADVETNLGAIYDPVADKWTSVNPPSGWSQIGDAPGVILANGTFMMGQLGLYNSALFNESTLSWTTTGSNKPEYNIEENWSLLPNGKVLNVKIYAYDQYNATGTGSEIYDPSTGLWSDAGSTIVQLWDSAANCGGKNSASYELGPLILRPDGTVFVTGANSCGAGHTAIYNTATGTWKAGPDFPNGLDAADAPAAVETNGKVLIMTSPGVYQTPPTFLEWDGTSFTVMPTPASASGDSSWYGAMLELPSGQILFSDLQVPMQVWTPAGTYQTAWQPTVSSVSGTLAPGSTYAISGTQFNGLTQGAYYGDDQQFASNYPLVRIVNSSTGHVFYCRTHGHSSMGVATGSTPVSTNFDVPANIENGASTLYVVANGIPSAPVPVTVGSGSSTTASLSATSLTFASTNVGSSSSAQNVTLKNNGPGSISASSVVVTGDFTQTNNCGTLASGASCTISVTFKPTASGTRSGTLSVTDNAANSPQSASLSGTGAGSGGASITLTPTSYNFGNVVVNNYSNWQAFTLANTGSTAVSVAAPTVSGPFSVSNSCNATLAAGANCTIWVLFAPTTGGAASGTLTASAGGTSKTSALSGTGTTANSTVSISPTSYNFGSVAVNASSSWQGFTLSNTGSAAASISNVAVTGPFAVSNACGASLAAGANCTLWVMFQPKTSGAASGKLTATAGGSAQLSATLSGTGTGGNSSVTLSPGSYNFGSVSVESYSNWVAFTLSNNGTSAAALGSAAVNNAQFQVSSYCGTSLAAGSNCTIWVLFGPTASGATSGSLSITAAGAAQTAQLSGTGTSGPTSPRQEQMPPVPVMTAHDVLQLDDGRRAEEHRR